MGLEPEGEKTTPSVHLSELLGLAVSSEPGACVWLCARAPGCSTPAGAVLPPTPSVPSPPRLRHWSWSVWDGWNPSRNAPSRAEHLLRSWSPLAPEQEVLTGSAGLWGVPQAPWIGMAAPGAGEIHTQLKVRGSRRKSRVPGSGLELDCPVPGSGLTLDSHVLGPGLCWILLDLG